LITASIEWGQALREGLETWRFLSANVLTAEQADPGNPCRLLRRGGERRGEEATSDASNERPPLHHSIT
jgi:hypothetical protein